MAQKPELPEQNTVQFLNDKFNNDVSELTLHSGGQWSQAYSFVSGGKKYVLRWCHSSETFEKDAVASTLSSAAMPVPKMIDAGREFDTYYAITEFAEGTFIDKLSSAEVLKLLPALLGLFDALRTTDLSQTSGYGGWNKEGVGDDKTWKEYLLSVSNTDAEDHTKGWYNKLAQTPIGTHAFDQLYPQFRALVDKCPENRELIHSDLLNFNLLTLDDKISGVIDWQCSLYGDALYDVAWFIFYEPWYPEFGAVNLGQKLMDHFVASSGSDNIKERLLCYQLHIGLGSIVYNTFRENWPALQEVIDYTLKVAGQAT
jgi:hygromycin-B 4-O-kinase